MTNSIKFWQLLASSASAVAKQSCHQKKNDNLCFLHSIPHHLYTNCKKNWAKNRPLRHTPNNCQNIRTHAVEHFEIYEKDGWTDNRLPALTVVCRMDNFSASDQILWS